MCVHYGITGLLLRILHFCTARRETSGVLVQQVASILTLSVHGLILTVTWIPYLSLYNSANREKANNDIPNSYSYFFRGRRFFKPHETCSS